MLQSFPIHAYLPAADVGRARRFYEQTIGLTAAETLDEDGVVYRFAGGTACFLYETPNAGTSKASQAFWQVDDVDRLVVALRARGVVFETYDELPGERSPQGALIAGGAKTAWFKDTEGNILALVQELPRTEAGGS